MRILTKIPKQTKTCQIAWLVKPIESNSPGYILSGNRLASKEEYESLENKNKNTYRRRHQGYTSRHSIQPNQRTHKKIWIRSDNKDGSQVPHWTQPSKQRPRYEVVCIVLYPSASEKEQTCRHFRAAKWTSYNDFSSAVDNKSHSILTQGLRLWSERRCPCNPVWL